MQPRHVLPIATIAALALLCTLLPFFPGRYDGLAVALSTMAQVAGTVGLLLVPVAASWLLVERVERLAGLRLAARLAAFAALAVVGAAVVLAAAVQDGFALAFATAALGVFAARRAWPSFLRLGEASTEHAGALPLYLIAVPLLVAALQYLVVDDAVAFSRDRAIRNSAPLLEAIERSRVERGEYPESLLAVNPDFFPGVVGIQAYHYERRSESYQLVFEQLTYRIGTRELVVYNPRDEHVMTSHARDLLELGPEDLALERTRGHYDVRDLPHRHWKFFWFD
jgi:hypothetical protein